MNGTEYGLAARILENLGSAGLLIWVVWKLVDRWAGKFLEVQSAQAKAMGDLAGAVRDSLGDQRELLIAVRVLATKVEEQKQWLKELGETLKRPGRIEG